jgi:hypothetical protein
MHIGSAAVTNETRRPSSPTGRPGASCLTLGHVGDRQVRLDELGAWIARCRTDTARSAEPSDDQLRKHYTVMPVVRILLFGHVAPSGEPSNPVVDGLTDHVGPCLDAAYGEATRREWTPTALRDAARQVLSAPTGSVVDPVAIFRAG